jgi:hypothetical protein
MVVINSLNRLQLATFRFFILGFFFSFSFVAKAQEATNSPYSAYGIGDVNPKSFGNTYAMGGATIAMQNDTTPMYFINNANPASYSSVRFTTADLAIRFNRTQLQTSGDKQATNTGAIGHLALVFPIKKNWWGASAGILPYSSVGYKVSQSTTITNVGDVDLLYVGNGGLNQAYFGNAVKPLYWLPAAFLQSKKYEQLKQEKNDSLIKKILKRKKALRELSIGANASYMFGNLNYTQYSIFPTNGNNFNTSTGTTTRVSDFYFDYGMQYAFTVDSIKGRDLKENVKIMMGATMSTQTNLNARVDSLSYSYFNNINGAAVIKDTIINSSGRRGDITIPLSFGFGLAVKKGNRWLLAADYAVQNWSQFKMFNQSQGFKNSNRISFGVQYVPKNDGRYLERVNYRIGGRYAQTMIVVNNYQLIEQAITFGLGLPVSTQRAWQIFSMVNIGVEFGTRGTTTHNLVKEQFFKASLGFTINEAWFLPRKYD